MLKVIELFAGIGAPRMALRDLGISHEVIGISEIDINAIQAYEKIHGRVHNFGDIRLINSLPECDLLHFSSPCVSFSNAGKKDGLNGASGLLLEVFRLLKDYKDRNCLPTYISFENVKEVKEKFTDVYNNMIDFFNQLGYNIYENILNAAYFDNPQKRERIFLIGIKKENDNNTFKMPENTIQTKLRLKDVLLNRSELPINCIHDNNRFENRHKRVRAIPKNTFQTIEDGYYYTEKSTARTQSNRIYNRNGLCPTLTTVPFVNILEEDCVRKLTPLEYWRAMGFSDDDFNKVDNMADTPLIKLAGNSICLGPMKAVFKELFKGGNENV